MSVEDSWYAVDRSTGKKVRTKRSGRGKRWRVRNRGTATRSFDRKSDADAYDVEVRSQRQQGITPYDPIRGRLSFRDYAEKWLSEHHYAESSRQTVRGHMTNYLYPTFGHLALAQIEHSTVTEWLARMRTTTVVRTGRPLSANYIGQVYVTLATIMKSAVADKRITVSPCASVPAPQVPERPEIEVWEDGTVHALLDALPDQDHGIALLAATCGLRQGEAFGVARGDIRALRGELVVQHQLQRIDGRPALIPPKRGRTRTVPLPQITADALALHLGRYPTVTLTCTCHGTQHELLFSRQGKPHRANDWNRAAWHPTLRAAGLDPTDDTATGLHQLRHYAASLWIAGGATLTEVQRWLGHKSVRTTEQVYAHLFRRSADRGRTIMDAAFAARAYPLRTQQAH